MSTAAIKSPSRDSLTWRSITRIPEVLHGVTRFELATKYNDAPALKYAALPIDEQLKQLQVRINSHPEVFAPEETQVIKALAVDSVSHSSSLGTPCITASPKLANLLISNAQKHAELVAKWIEDLGSEFSLKIYNHALGAIRALNSIGNYIQKEMKAKGAKQLKEIFQLIQKLKATLESIQENRSQYAWRIPDDFHIPNHNFELDADSVSWDSKYRTFQHAVFKKPEFQCRTDELTGLAYNVSALFTQLDNIAAIITKTDKRDFLERREVRIADMLDAVLPLAADLHARRDTLEKKVLAGSMADTKFKVQSQL